MDLLARMHDLVGTESPNRIYTSMRRKTKLECQDSLPEQNAGKDSAEIPASFHMASYWSGWTNAAGKEAHTSMTIRPMIQNHLHRKCFGLGCRGLDHNSHPIVRRPTKA